MARSFIDKSSNPPVHAKEVSCRAAEAEAAAAVAAEQKKEQGQRDQNVEAAGGCDGEEEVRGRDSGVGGREKSRSSSSIKNLAEAVRSSFRERMESLKSLKSLTGGGGSGDNNDSTYHLPTWTSSSESSSEESCYERRCLTAHNVDVVLKNVRGRSFDAFARRVFEEQIAWHITEYFSEEDGLGRRELVLGSVRDVQVTVKVHSARVLAKANADKSTLEGVHATVAAASQQPSCPPAPSSVMPVEADVQMVYSQTSRFSTRGSYDASRVLLQGAFHSEEATDAFKRRLRGAGVIDGRMGAFERVGSVGLPSMGKSVELTEAEEEDLKDLEVGDAAPGAVLSAAPGTDIPSAAEIDEDWDSGSDPVLALAAAPGDHEERQWPETNEDRCRFSDGGSAENPDLEDFQDQKKVARGSDQKCRCSPAIVCPSSFKCRAALAVLIFAAAYGVIMAVSVSGGGGGGGGGSKDAAANSDHHADVSGHALGPNGGAKTGVETVSLGHEDDEGGHGSPPPQSGLDGYYDEAAGEDLGSSATGSASETADLIEDWEEWEKGEEEKWEKEKVEEEKVIEEEEGKEGEQGGGAVSAAKKEDGAEAEGVEGSTAEVSKEGGDEKDIFRHHKQSGMDVGAGVAHNGSR